MSWIPEDNRRCPHTESSIDHAAGIERAVCRSCGHVTFRFAADASRAAERTKFSRPADRRAGAPPPPSSRGFWSR
ncbi:MAG: hypothetical protein R6X29_10345 [Acidimicrobiia bacterium]|jgi:hypothetical protein